MKKVKLNLVITTALSLVVFSVASCGKYEDGPNISFRSKEARLCEKTWVLESVNMAGMDMSAEEIQTEEGGEFQMELKKDGTVTFTDNMGMNPETGKWQFQKNDSQFKVSGINSDKTDLNTITRLTNKELWFWHMDGNDKMIMHYKTK